MNMDLLFPFEPLLSPNSILSLTIIVRDELLFLRSLQFFQNKVSFEVNLAVPQEQRSTLQWALFQSPAAL